MSQPSQPESRPPIPPAFVLVFGILSVSTASIYIRYAQGLGVPSLVIAAGRLGLATLLLAPLALIRYRQKLRRLGRREWWLALLSGAFLAIHFATWISSLNYTTVASSVVLVTTAPLWVALLSPLALKERIGRLVAIGLLLALLGGIIVGVADACTFASGRLVCPSPAEFLNSAAFLGDLLALAGALAGAGYLLIGRRLRTGISLIVYIFVVYGVAAVLLGGIMASAGYSYLGHPPEAYLWLLLLAIIPQLFGHSSFNWALRYLSAAYVSITLLGEPVGSTLLAYFLLAERPGAVKLIGAILILAGIYIASLSESKTPVAPDVAPEPRPEQP